MTRTMAPLYRLSSRVRAMSLSGMPTSISPVSRYGVPPEFMYRLPDDGECISYPSLMKVAVCEKTF